MLEAVYCMCGMSLHYYRYHFRYRHFWTRVQVSYNIYFPHFQSIHNYNKQNCLLCYSGHLQRLAN